MLELEGAELFDSCCAVVISYLYGEAFGSENAADGSSFIGCCFCGSFDCDLLDTDYLDIICLGCATIGNRDG